MKKKLLAISLSAAMAISASSFASTGLTLNGSNMSHQIVVSCNDITSPLNIPKDGKLGPLSYRFISKILFKSSLNLACTFTLNGTTTEIGAATFAIASNYATAVATPTYIDPDYTVNIDNEGVPAQEITVTISPNT